MSDKFALDLAAAIDGEIAGTGGGCRALFFPRGAEDADHSIYLMLTNGDADVPDDEDVMIITYRRDAEGYWDESDEDDYVEFEGATVETVAAKVAEMAVALGINNKEVSA